MKNFQRLLQGVNVMPLAHQLQIHPELWNENTLRTSHEATPHKAVEDIWLRFQDLDDWEETKDPAKVVDEHESIFYPAWWVLTEAHGFIFDLMRMVQGTRLGRVLITKLPPGKRIDAHVDGGSHAAYFSRYHLVLQGLPGALFRCGDETVCMQTGEVWYFDNSVEHECANNSADDRIHMIIDIRNV